MPSINAAQFRAEAEKVNKTLGRFVKSSLEPLFAELGTQPTVMADATKMAKLQQLIFKVPPDSYTKYRAAFDILKNAGLAICPALPCDPTMHFVRFDTGDYAYVGRGSAGEKMVTLNPGSLHHVFDFKWKSTNGNLQSLNNIATREFVKFRTSQQAPPFTDAMPTDMQFFWGESDSAKDGFGRDDHSVKPPKLICRFPWVAGENVAEQWYQYSADKKATWHNIPGAAYLLTKGVRQSQGEWVFFFKKCNWAPHNTKPFNFEVEYKLGAPLSAPPKVGQKFMRTNGSTADITKFARVISLG